MSALMGSVLPASPPHASDTAGVFLHDFFGRILPQDRNAAKPAMLVHHWKRVTQSVGVIAWVLLVAMFGILLSVSFAGNKQTLALVQSARPDKVALNGNLFHDAAALTYSNDVLMQVAQNDRRWMSGLLGNGAGLASLEARLHDVFVQQYRQAIQPAADQSQQTALAASVGQAGPPVEQAGQLLNLARSIALLRARMGGANRATLEAMPQPVATSLYPAQLNAQLNPLTVSYLVWSPNDAGYLQDRAGARIRLLGRQRTTRERNGRCRHALGQRQRDRGKRSERREHARCDGSGGLYRRGPSGARRTREADSRGGQRS
jgi:type VI secretion system protein ImpL